MAFQRSKWQGVKVNTKVKGHPYTFSAIRQSSDSIPRTESANPANQVAPCVPSSDEYTVEGHLIGDNRDNGTPRISSLIADHRTGPDRLASHVQVSQFSVTSSLSVKQVLPLVNDHDCQPDSNLINHATEGEEERGQTRDVASSSSDAEDEE